MNSISSRKTISLNKLVFTFLHKIFQRPDFYPIKYYHKRRREKMELGEL
ncbi:MAG: hypothetical protein M9933_05730 [Chitinophagaceae bacterium]|nr:hypothetical protein [Chitinophagaceae bacterium]